MSTPNFALKSCLSLDSYIKPQPSVNSWNNYVVVYLLIPTSNHNSDAMANGLTEVVYLLIPTSNHNQEVASLISLQLFIS